MHGLGGQFHHHGRLIGSFILLAWGAVDYHLVTRILTVAVTGIVGELRLEFAAFLLDVMQIKHR